MNPKIVCFGFFFYFVSTSDKKGKNNLNMIIEFINLIKLIII